MTEPSIAHDDLANALRALAMDAVEKAQSGHPGMPMGMADVATVLFTRHMKFFPQRPEWPDRDRFVLSAGHGSMLLYGLLHLTGSPDMGLEELQRFRQLGSRTAGHPEHGHAMGIETTTGPLGQGLATAVGMALAERLLAAKYGADLVDHRTYVIAQGDQSPGDRQPQPQPAIAVRDAALGAPKFVEDRCLLVGGNADAGVTHGDGHG